MRASERACERASEMVLLISFRSPPFFWKTAKTVNSCEGQGSALIFKSTHAFQLYGVTFDLSIPEQRGVGAGGGASSSCTILDIWTYGAVCLLEALASIPLL